MYENNLEYHCIENFDTMKSFRKKMKKQKKDLERKLNYMELKMGKPIPTMTDKEAKCYLKRYTKLLKVFGKDIQKAKNHWKRYGFEENRNKNCYDEDNNILLEDEDIIEDNNEGSFIII